jgi:hypothetical protein
MTSGAICRVSPGDANSGPLLRQTSGTERSLLVIGSFMGSAPVHRYVSGDLACRLSDRGWRVWITSRKQSRLARLADMLKTT